jgi:hypothetical protein
MANPTMTLISSQTLGGTTASVTFSSIPSTYNDLKLVVSARGDTAAYPVAINLKLNSDTATNYSYTNLLGNSSTVLSTRASSQTVDAISNVDGASATASTFGAWEIYIPNYTSTGSKPFFGIDVVETNDTTAAHAEIQANAHLYRGASGISSITLTPSSGNFVQYSTFTLYGIKNS